MKKKTSLILLCLLLPALAAVMFAAGIGSALELKTLDWRFVLRGPDPVKDNVLVVAIGDESVSPEVLGRWPWRRAYMASFINIVSRYSPRSIVFDILFTEPSVDFPTDDVMFAEQAETAANVYFPFFVRAEDAPRARGYSAVMDEANRELLEKISLGSASEYAGALFIEADSIVMPISILSEHAAGSGYVNATPDHDGITRRIPLIINHRDSLLPSVSFKAALDYLGASSEDVTINPGRNITVRTPERTIRIPVDSRQRMLVNHSGEFSTENMPLLSFIGLIVDHEDFLSGEEKPDSLKKIEDKVVFLGLTATGTVDLRPTPFSTVFPMVSFLANGTANIIEGNFLKQASPFTDILIILFLGFAAALITVKFKAVPSAVFNMILLSAFFLVSFYLFRNNYVISAFYPFASVIFSYAGITVYKFTGEEQEKKVIRNMFQRYVSSQVVDSLLQHPETIKLGGEKRYLTMFFSDIRGFTTMSENLQPEEVVHILNEYLTKMIEIIFKYNGTLDKFMGDAIMAIWGAPTGEEKHAEKALRAAVEMRDSLEQLQKKWKAEGKKSIAVGMGINTGNVVVGNMGSEQFADYTVIGDDVNLAARLEQNAGPGQILLSEETYKIVEDIVNARKLEPLKVKGKEKPINVYEVYGLKN